VPNVSIDGVNSPLLHIAQTTPELGGDFMEEILTAAQVAELLQMHPRTVYKLVKQGSIPGRKCGGGWRFRRSEIMVMVSPRGEGKPMIEEGGE